jgi:membrane associated rhomboid family serine protease
MSSLHVPPASITPEDRPRANEHPSADAPAVVEKLPLMRVEDPLKDVTRWTPVTWVLVAANVALFAGMALVQQRVFDFSPHCLLTWGGGLAPRVFGARWWGAASDLFAHGDLAHLAGHMPFLLLAGPSVLGAEWWRAASYMFVHADLAHLASNMLFLLLAGPLLERVLGSMRFALVYLFAGLGGGLLGMGTSPLHVVVGASAAVFGVYGALLGCCLRGPRSIPWRMVGQRAGWLLVYTAVSLLGDWLDFTREPVAHLGGFAFGLAGGFLCGHKLQPRAARWRLWRLGVVFAICAGLIGFTAWGVSSCSSKAQEYYQAYAAIKDRERELDGQFHDVLLQWEQDRLTSAQFSQALQSRLIPALQEMRASHNLKFTGELAEMEKHSVTMPEFWKVLRSKRGEVHERDRKPLTLQEYGDRHRFVCKVRVDTWRALADELNDRHPFAVRALLDNHELDMLASSLDHEANEDNPLYRWFELRRTGRRQDRQDAVEPDGGLLKNRGFEAGLEGWTTYVGGPRPRFDFDTEVVREGRQALRVTASQPVDVACYQEVMLKPGQWSRFSGWVRTRGLDPRGSSVYGTFHVHARATNDFIAKGLNHGGDTEWTRVSLAFQARGDGLTRIVLYLVGFGQGTGTAWFDDLRLVGVSQPAR